MDIGAVLDDMGDVYDRLLKDEWTKASIDMEKRECILDKFEGEIQIFNQYYGNTKPYGINCAAYSREYEMLSKQYESEPVRDGRSRAGRFPSLRTCEGADAPWKGTALKISWAWLDRIRGFLTCMKE